VSPKPVTARSIDSHTVAATPRPSVVGSLATFFPEATPLRLSVQVETGAGTTERTVIEFGTAQEVMFSSSLALEFGDRLTINNLDGSLLAMADVVAVQFHAGAAAVAARFSQRVSNWIVKS
jgi:hypothetical protein